MTPPFKGIAFKIMLLSWTVTITTLIVFVSGIIPIQRRSLLDSLESKARGIAVSLQDVAAGAAVSEDYSSLVEHCMQMLSGDRAIDFVVIAKSDGLAIVSEQSGWRSEGLGKEWLPAGRQPASGIETVALFGRRVFRYSRPLDYSALQWGWIHVGLSLEAYDRSATKGYQRTGLLAVVCVSLSLAASLVFARRMTQPILSLREGVRRVTEGDFSARAVIRSSDEVESLAHSFNSMADSLLQRNRILESVRFAAQRLLSAEDWRTAIEDVLEKIGMAAHSSRSYVFKNHLGDDGALLCTQRYEWVAEGISTTRDREQWQGFRWYQPGFEDWANQLGQGQVVTAHVELLRKPMRDVLDPSIQSLISMPIRVGGQWWGFLGLDDCRRRREWSVAERDSLQAAADMIGAAILRQRSQQALLEAKQTLELRVLERTAELSELVVAKDRANAELAEAQQRLMEMSRLSGMAEVATSVLHNVGNVLNSVNVSTSVVTDRIREWRVDRMTALVAMLREHAPSLTEYMANDPKGQRVLPYLEKLAQHFQRERTALVGELELLTRHVEHIKEIVAVQQNYACVSGVVESIGISGLVEDAVRITRAGFDRHEIRFLRDFDEVPPVCADKHKVLQILLNLLRNAQHATRESGKPEKEICVRIRRLNEDAIRIQVRDNGVGLTPENLTRIFSHGFTTKRDGHGFGLHSGALAAREMGGALSVESKGPGLGAVFTLELPLNTRCRRDDRSRT